MSCNGKDCYGIKELFKRNVDFSKNVVYLLLNHLGFWELSCEVSSNKFDYIETAVRRCSSKQVFWKISQYSPENNRVAISNTGVLPVNVAKFYRSAFFIEHFWWLLLTIIFAKQSVYKIDCSLIFRRKISNWEKAFVYKSKYPLQ